MGFFGVIIVFVLIVIACRLLRAIFPIVDVIVGAALFIIPIIVWITNTFWAALLTFFGGAIVAGILFGLGDETDVNYGSKTYKIKCSDCGYGDLEILSQDEVCVVARCRRCGAKKTYVRP